MSAPLPYLVIQNTPEPILKPFSSLEELHKWATDELATNSPTQYNKTLTELLGIINFHTVEFKQEELPKTLFTDYSIFRKHPLYVHYAALSVLSTKLVISNYGLPYMPNHYLPIIKDFLTKKYLYTLREDKMFCELTYDHIVRVLYKAFGKVLPELAYNICYTFGYEGALHPIFKPDRKEVEKQWAQAFKGTFYRHSSDGVVKRTDFIEHINKHINDILSDLYILHNIKDVAKEIQSSELFTSPEKLLGLTTIRRSAGMYIACLERSDMTDYDRKKKSLLSLFQELFTTYYDRDLDSDKVKEYEMFKRGHPEFEHYYLMSVLGKNGIRTDDDDAVGRQVINDLQEKKFIFQLDPTESERSPKEVPWFTHNYPYYVVLRQLYLSTGKILPEIAYQFTNCYLVTEDLKKDGQPWRFVTNQDEIDKVLVRMFFDKLYELSSNPNDYVTIQDFRSAMKKEFNNFTSILYDPSNGVKSSSLPTQDQLRERFYSSNLYMMPITLLGLSLEEIGTRDCELSMLGVKPKM